MLNDSCHRIPSISIPSLWVPFKGQMFNFRGALSTCCMCRVLSCDGIEFAVKGLQTHWFWEQGHY